MEKGIPARLTPAEGRKFGLTVGAAFLVLAGLLFWRGHETGIWITGGLGTALLLGGLVVPGQLGPVYRAWMGLALVLSKVTTPIFLGIVYFLLFTPVGLVRRSFGTNPLRHRAAEAGYWAVRAPGGRRGDLERQF